MMSRTSMAAIGALFLLIALSRGSGPADGLPSTLPCPASPNCVSSRAAPEDAQHYIAPLALPPGPDGFDQVVRAAGDLPRAKLLERDDNTARFVYTTAILRFKDDLVLERDDDHQVVHVRSASRTGYGDLGVNRARVEAIRAQLAETSP